MEIDDVITCVRRYAYVNEMVLYSLSALKMVTVKKRKPATIQNTNESIRDALKLLKLRSAVLNPMHRFLARCCSLDTFVIMKPPHKRKIGPLLHRLVSLLRRSVFFSSHMRCGHQLVGVWPEHPASAKIKTAKISSEESGRFFMKISLYTIHGGSITVNSTSFDTHFRT